METSNIFHKREYTDTARAISFRVVNTTLSSSYNILCFCVLVTFSMLLTETSELPFCPCPGFVLRADWGKLIKKYINTSICMGSRIVYFYFYFHFDLFIDNFDILFSDTNKQDRPQRHFTTRSGKHQN